uniref:Calcipressin-2 n=1 Tax=Aceria tosichella TaxID=561515 RepID=A0A6G1S7Z1_9ACAR
MVVHYCNKFTERQNTTLGIVRMAQQQQANNFQFNSNNNNNNNNNGNNVDEITHRLDQMNVDTEMNEDQQQHQCVNIVSFREPGRRLENTDNDQERMSIDDENVQPASVGGCHQPQQRATQRGGESNILIVTNVDPSVFSDSLVKAKFESLFTVYDERVLFRYLKSFRRVRLDFNTPKAADMARLNMNNYKLGKTAFKCYLAQMIRPNRNNNTNSLDIDNRQNDYDDDRDTSSMYGIDEQHQNNFYLNIPKLSKQFLISPPVSPPEGWKPHDESSPCIDVQLISAIANLVPGQVHEIHPGNESQPGIFVEVCEENNQYDSPSSNSKTRIPKTANPIAAARAAIGQAMRSS